LIRHSWVKTEITLFGGSSAAPLFEPTKYVIPEPGLLDLGMPKYNDSSFAKQRKSEIVNLA
jgi:hypothetical protein